MSSFSKYVGNGAQTVFTVNQPMPSYSALEVSLDGVVETTGFTYNRTNATVTFAVAPADGVVIKLSRVTQVEPIHKFATGAAFTARNVDTNFTQESYRVEELQDNVVGVKELEESVLQASEDAEAVLAQLLASSTDYIQVGTFTAGYDSLQTVQQTLLYSDGHRYGWTGDFPKVVSAGSTPTPLGAGGWVDRSDVTLRGEIALSYKPFEAVLVIGESVSTGTNLTGQRNEVAVSATGTSDPVLVKLQSGLNLDLSQTDIHCVGIQNYRVIGGVDVEDVSISGLKVRSDSTAGNDAMAAVFFGLSSGVDAKGVALSNSYLLNTSWGALCSAEVGAGTMYGIRYSGNYVDAIDNPSAADGLHIAGRWVGASAVGNVVIGRHDASLAMNMTGSHNGRGGAVAGHVSVDNLVGLDFSGGRYISESGNTLVNGVQHAASNPAWRCITYSGCVPSYIVGGPGIAVSNGTTSGEVDVKFDTAGAEVHGMIIGKMFKTAYVNSGSVSIKSCHILNGGRVVVDTQASNTHITDNTFEGAFDIVTPANPSLGGDIYIGKPDWRKSTVTNFLPNYTYWFKNASGQNVICDSDTLSAWYGAFATTSATNVDVTESFFVVRYPCILSDIDAVADCASHSGYVAVCKADGTEVANARFDVTAGAGGTNVVGRFNAPIQASNVYMPKLDPGVYKLMARSELNQITIKHCTLRMWG